MASFTVDYDITKYLDDVSRMLFLQMKDRPLLNMISIGAARVGEADRKFKWPEEVEVQAQTTLTVTYTAGSGVIDVASTANFQALDRVHIRNHLDANFNQVIFQVTSIGVNQLNVTVVAGVDTTFVLASPAQIIIGNRGYGDNAAAGTGKVTEPDWLENYLQLFQTDLEIGRKAQNITVGGLTPGMESAFITGMRQKMNQLSWQMYNAFLYGTARAESSAAPALTKGVLNFVNTTSNVNREDAGATLLTEQHINNLVNKLFNEGLYGDSTNKVLLGSPAKIRRVASLRHDKVQYITESTQDSLGGRVTVYVPDMPEAGAYKLVADNNMPENVVLLLDMDALSMVFAAGGAMAEVEETTPPGNYGKRYTIRSEMGMMVQGALRSHGAIVNLI